MISNTDRSDRDVPPSPLFPLAVGSEDHSEFALSKSEFLTAEETIRRRHRHVRQLYRIYRDHYWALIAELRTKYRDYLWNEGASPFLSDSINAEAQGHQPLRCAHPGCKQKAMPMTTFCHSHILSDPNQVLYKACAYLTFKSGTKAHTVCGKPILRSVTPSFCNYHLQRAEKAVARAFKSAGLSNRDSSRMAPLIHIIGTECARQILSKRRGLREARLQVNKLEEDPK